jgi:hypothetical protein
LAPLAALVRRGRGPLVAPHADARFDIPLVVPAHEGFLILRVSLIAFAAACRAALRPASKATDADAMFLAKCPRHTARIFATGGHRSSKSYDNNARRQLLSLEIRVPAVREADRVRAPMPWKWDAAFRAHSCPGKNEDSVSGGNCEHQWKVYRASELLNVSWHAENRRMLRSASPRENLFADKTLANVLTDRNKHFAEPLGVDGALATLSLIACGHVALDPNL